MAMEIEWYGNRFLQTGLKLNKMEQIACCLHMMCVWVFKLHCICHFSQSALQLTEVLKERDAQLEFKQLKEAAMQGKDKAYLEQAQRDLEEAIRRDQEEAQKRIIAAKQNKGFIKAQ